MVGSWALTWWCKPLVVIADTFSVFLIKPHRFCSISILYMRLDFFRLIAPTWKLVNPGLVLFENAPRKCIRHQRILPGQRHTTQMPRLEVPKPRYVDTILDTHNILDASSLYFYISFQVCVSQSRAGGFGSSWPPFAPLLSQRVVNHAWFYLVGV